MGWWFGRKMGAALGIGTLSRRGRSDAVTALALMLMLALGAAFLSQSSEDEPQIFSLLFGEILGVSTSQIWPVAVLGAVCILAVAVLYRAHALCLTRLAYVMLGDRGLAEDIVQEAFAGLHWRWARLSDPPRAVFYLRSSVLNGCRSVLRRSTPAGVQ